MAVSMWPRTLSSVLGPCRIVYVFPDTSVNLKPVAFDQAAFACMIVYGFTADVTTRASSVSASASASVRGGSIDRRSDTRVAQFFDESSSHAPFDPVRAYTYARLENGAPRCRRLGATAAGQDADGAGDAAAPALGSGPITPQVEQHARSGTSAPTETSPFAVVHSRLRCQSRRRLVSEFLRVHISRGLRFTLAVHWSPSVVPAPGARRREGARGGRLTEGAEGISSHEWRMRQLARVETRAGSCDACACGHVEANEQRNERTHTPRGQRNDVGRRARGRGAKKLHDSRERVAARSHLINASTVARTPPRQTFSRTVTL
eukprot:7391363-Prymnesium_polylepis.1